MLVLSRKNGEQLIVGDTLITVTKISGDRVSLSISAPPSVRVLRGEIAQAFSGPTKQSPRNSRPNEPFIVH